MSNTTRPAVLGGEPAFAEKLAFVRPPLPELERVLDRFRPSYEAGRLTNGPLVRELEAQARARLGVAHAVAVSSCTVGLMLVMRALELRGRVMLPSFTFSATAHALAWNGLEPVFAECDPATFQLDPADAADRMEGASALVATHVFGAPCPVEALARLAGEDVPVVFDAAHALGASRAGRPVGGFGTAEVFSLSPTKPVVAGEGGIVTTDRDDVADRVRAGLDYGTHDGEYDSMFPGLNGRLSELHAALALESLAELDDHLTHRRALADRYRAGLAGIPGVALQAVDEGDASTWKDLTIILDEQDFGLRRDRLVEALAAEGIETRCYFSPPVHRQQAYLRPGAPELPVTTDVAARVVSLPLYRSLSTEAVDRVVGALGAIHAHAAEVESTAR